MGLLLLSMIGFIWYILIEHTYFKNKIKYIIMILFMVGMMITIALYLAYEDYKDRH